MKTTLLLFLAVSLSHCQVPLTLIRSRVTKFVNASNISKDCAADLSLLISDLFDQKMWAMKMLDSTSKLNAGILNANVHFIGDYDMCLSIKEETQTRTVEGQYCTAVVMLDEKFLSTIKHLLKLEKIDKMITGIVAVEEVINPRKVAGVIGICAPKTCRAGDLETLAQDAERKFNLSAHLYFREELCIHKNQPTKINKLDLIIYCGIIIMGFVLVGSTIYDVYFQGSGVFRIFSMYTNLKKLLHQSNHRKLSCVSGIKVLSCFWVLLGHTTLLAIAIAKNVVYNVAEWRYEPVNTFAWAGHYSVDSFFMVSGLLLSYTFLKNSRKVSMSLIEFYFKRLSRLMPTMVVIILIIASVLKLCIDGPYGPVLLQVFIENCYGDWPSILFFTFNFMRDPKCGINHLWYLSSDTQLYFLAPVFLFFIIKHPRKVIAGMSAMFLFSVGYSVAVTFMKNLGFTFYDWSEDYGNYFIFSTTHRLPSWLIGVFCGYLLQFENVKIPKKLNICLLFLSFLSMILLVVSQLSLLDGEYNVYRVAVWTGLARPVWSLAVAYVVFSCATGHGEIFRNNQHFSFPLCVPSFKRTYT
ncbi:O-acyltransferase like protein-like isoform X2 [Zophobas morio]|uniref:O-acyltransferase like protein-like isoform X2 n=1 Tax=Zophobas morio TaxID=2755281 RepID=UPI0030831A08